MYSGQEVPNLLRRMLTGQYIIDETTEKNFVIQGKVYFFPGTVSKLPRFVVANESEQRAEAEEG
jgi:hypothetical protein